jgi:signal transduction histidine kinase
MSDTAALLQANRAELAARAARELAPDEGLRASFEAEMNEFFDRLAMAVRIDRAEWLHGILSDWVEARSSPPIGDPTRPSLVPLLFQLKNHVWDLLAAECPPAEALPAARGLDAVFANSLAHVIRLESEALAAEVEDRMSASHADLEKLDRSKSSFIAVAAHELKTPLTLIEGYSRMIADDVSGPDFAHLQALMDGVHTGTRRLREIVDDMVDVSLIDNQMLSLTHQPVWVRRMVEHVQYELADVLEQRRLHLEFQDFDDTGQPTLGDPARLYQVFRNVITNAVKFTPDGGRITVSARPLPGFVQVTVADTGIGIAPENQERIFEKFGGLGDASLHSTGKTKFKGGGAGLGLAIARGIIEAHGGAIWCESPGHDEVTCPGSTFHLMVPMRSELPGSPITRSYGLKQEEVELISRARVGRKA